MDLKSMIVDEANRFIEMNCNLEEEFAAVLDKYEKEAIDNIQLRKEILIGRKLWIDTQRACWKHARRGDKLQAELDENRWIPVTERLPGKVEYFAVTDGKQWWREFWCFVDHSGAKGWEDNPNCITHWRPITLPEGE